MGLICTDVNVILKILHSWFWFLLCNKMFEEPAIRWPGWAGNALQLALLVIQVGCGQRPGTCPREGWAGRDGSSPGGDSALPTPWFMPRDTDFRLSLVENRVLLFWGTELVVLCLSRWMVLKLAPILLGQPQGRVGGNSSVELLLGPARRRHAPAGCLGWNGNPQCSQEPMWGRTPRSVQRGSPRRVAHPA